MRIKNGIHGNELQTFLAQDLKQRVLAPSSPLGSQSSAESKVVSTAKAKEWLRAAQEAADEVGRMPPEPPTLRARAGAVFVQLVRRMLFWLTPQINSSNQAMLSVIQEQTSLIDQLAGQFAGIKTQLNEIAAGQYRIRERVDSEISRIDQQLLGYNEQLGHYGDQFLNYTQSADAARELVDKQLLQLRTIQFANERRLAELSGQGGIQVAPSVESKASENDSLYLLLEDQFRGSREDIKSRLLKYLPYVREVAAGTSEAPALDLGCGRGEWLELLRDHGLQASGVDLNRTFVLFGQELGLDVTLGDAIVNLRERPENSLGCVTGFHIVEHLPWPALVELTDAVVRVLKPGGLAIFETPNPENVQVGSKNFYFDPTHRNPIPPLLLKFLLDARGFYNVEVIRIHPYPEAMHLPEDGLVITRRFNEFFYGPQDYAVIGRKP